MNVAISQTEKTNQEMHRLFRAYRIAWLNKSYYEYLADQIKWVVIALQVFSAVVSSGAFVMLMQDPNRVGLAKWFALAAAAASLLLTFTGWQRDHAEFRTRSVQNAELHADIKKLLSAIRRTGGNITPEQAFWAEQLYAKEVTLESIELLPQKPRLIERLTARMNVLFPIGPNQWAQF